jgi:hypothetical protein
MSIKTDSWLLELELLDMATTPATSRKKKKAQSLQERRTNAASCILFAMPRTPLKRELQAITPLKFFGRELF